MWVSAVVPWGLVARGNRSWVGTDRSIYVEPYRRIKQDALCIWQALLEAAAAE